jgi:hypothetical protein
MQTKTARAQLIRHADHHDDAEGDRHHDQAEGTRKSEPDALLVNAEQRIADLLRRPFTRSVAAAIQLIARKVARGGRLSFALYPRTNTIEVFALHVQAAAAGLGRGSEERRRQTLRDLETWCDWAQGDGGL